jgi:hypothetical protein
MAVNIPLTYKRHRYLHHSYCNFGKLQIISMYPNLTLHWDNGKSLAKNQNGKEIEQGIKPWIRNG